MKRRLFILVMVLSIALLLVAPASADFPAPNPAPGEPSWADYPVLPAGCIVEPGPGQEFVVCLPEAWNGVLMIYAHGYTSVYPRTPAGPVTPWNLSFEEFGALVGTPDTPGLIQTALDTGSAVAMTSYSTHGYAIEQALGDIPLLYQHFYTNYVLPLNPAAPPPPVIMTGASEGGLVTTTILEKVSAGQISMPVIGGLAACGPLAGTEWQVEYLGDFRVWFDHFFSGVLPGNVANVPADTWVGWDPELNDDPGDADLVGMISQAIIDDFKHNRGRKTKSLFLLTGAPIDYNFRKADSYYPTAVQVLYYSIWGTDDLISKAGGQPYDNTDERLLRYLYPYTADPMAETYLRDYYAPTGNLAMPLVTLHTTRDPAVPVAHEFIYARRADSAGSSDYLTTLIVPRYGHCNFRPYELQIALWLLQNQISQTLPAALSEGATAEEPVFEAAPVDERMLDNAGIEDVDLTEISEDQLLK